MTPTENRNSTDRAVRPSPTPRDERGRRIVGDGRAMPEDQKPRPPFVDAVHSEVIRLLTEHRERREQLEQPTRALLAPEMLDAIEAYAAAGVGIAVPA